MASLVERALILSLKSSSGGMGTNPIASALFKPDWQVSRIRLAQILSIEGGSRGGSGKSFQEPQAEALQVEVN